jgi:DNA-directed RNA polymerase specialized sigma24 family protein
VTHPQARPDPAFGLLKLYDDALPHVYGYLLARCGDTGLAEDLTADRLGAHHRAALTLRYLDGLPVPEVARHLDRTVHATEALLVRARAAFRRIYEEQEGS